MKSTRLRSDEITAIIERRKTIILRPLSVQPPDGFVFNGLSFASDKGLFMPSGTLGTLNNKNSMSLKPPYILGQFYWVRERFAKVMGGEPFGFSVYKSNKETVTVESSGITREKELKWLSASDMEEKDSRIAFEVISITAKHINDLSTTEMMQVGTGNFKVEWDIRYFKQGLDTEKNPWVWVIGIKARINRRS